MAEQQWLHYKRHKNVDAYFLCRHTFIMCASTCIEALKCFDVAISGYRRYGNVTATKPSSLATMEPAFAI